MRVLITGGAGFIGYHLADRLSREPAARLVLVDNFARGKQDADLAVVVARPNVELVSADLTDPAALAGVGADFDEVYHLAAIIGVSNVLRVPQEVLRVNALSTLHVLEWFRKGGGRKLLFSSTSEAYAWTQRFHPLPVPTPEDVPLAVTELTNPRSSYAGSKIFGELAVLQYGAAYGRPVVVTRYHNVYGPRMGYEHVIPELFERARAGQDPLVVYSADHRRAFCYVADAIEATVRAMRTEAANGRVFNVGNDREEVTIRELAGRLLRAAGLSAGLSAREAANDPVARRCPDIGRARQLLGFEPTVSLDEGLRRTLDWYAARTR